MIVKDPADVCQALAHLEHEERLRVLRRWLLGEGANDRGRERLRQRWPDGARLAAAWQLARDVDALADLLAGRAVDPERLDEGGVFAARQRQLVRLVSPRDLIAEGAE